MTTSHVFLLAQVHVIACKYVHDVHNVCQLFVRVLISVSYVYEWRETVCCKCMYNTVAMRAARDLIMSMNTIIVMHICLPTLEICIKRVTCCPLKTLKCLVLLEL